MQKKDDKVGNKTTNKEKKEGKKGERERKIEIDGKKKKKKKQVQIFCFAHSWKTRKLFNYVRLVGKYAFFFFGKTHFQPFSC